MELAIIIYLINVFGNLGCFFIAVGAASLVIVGFSAAIFAEVGESATAITTLKKGSIFALTMLFLGLLMPSEKTSYTMLAAYGVTEIAANERVQDIAGSSLDLLEQTIKEYTDKADAKKE